MVYDNEIPFFLLFFITFLRFTLSESYCNIYPSPQYITFSDFDQTSLSFSKFFEPKSSKFLNIDEIHSYAFVFNFTKLRTQSYDTLTVNYFNHINASWNFTIYNSFYKISRQYKFNYDSNVSISYTNFSFFSQYDSLVINAAFISNSNSHTLNNEDEYYEILKENFPIIQFSSFTPTILPPIISSSHDEINVTCVLLPLHSFVKFSTISISNPFLIPSFLGEISYSIPETGYQYSVFPIISNSSQIIGPQAYSEFFPWYIDPIKNSLILNLQSIKNQTLIQYRILRGSFQDYSQSINNWHLSNTEFYYWRPPNYIFPYQSAFPTIQTISKSSEDYPILVENAVIDQFNKTLIIDKGNDKYQITFHYNNDTSNFVDQLYQNKIVSVDFSSQTCDFNSDIVFSNISYRLIISTYNYSNQSFFTNEISLTDNQSFYNSCVPLFDDIYSFTQKRTSFLGRGNFIPLQYLQNMSSLIINTNFGNSTSNFEFTDSMRQKFWRKRLQAGSRPLHFEVPFTDSNINSIALFFGGDTCKSPGNCNIFSVIHQEEMDNTTFSLPTKMLFDFYPYIDHKSADVSLFCKSPIYPDQTKVECYLNVLLTKTKTERIIIETEEPPFCVFQSPFIECNRSSRSIIRISFNASNEYQVGIGVVKFVRRIRTSQSWVLENPGLSATIIIICGMVAISILFVIYFLVCDKKSRTVQQAQKSDQTNLINIAAMTSI